MSCSLKPAAIPLAVQGFSAAGRCDHDPLKNDHDPLKMPLDSGMKKRVEVFDGGVSREI